MKYLLITDIPAPWREKVYENVFNKFGNEFHVVYCKHNEKRRLWNFPLGKHPKTFLKSITIESKHSKENFINFGIIPFLIKNKPRIIICFSLNPTIYMSFLVAKLLNCKVAVFADTWLDRDGEVSSIHKLARKIYCNFFPDAFIGASKQTLNWFKYYNHDIKEEQLFLSSLCADNDFFLEFQRENTFKRKYDLMFSGRIVARKNPLFFVEVAAKIKKKLGSCSVLIIGDGEKEIKDAMFRALEKNDIDYTFPGFINHSELPKYYSQSKILLLPTSGDCWGVVINEAMVCGAPVLTTNMTAAAGELVLNDKNGYVLPLDSDQWTEKIISLLSNEEKLEKFSETAQETVKEFNFDRAAQGIIETIEYLEKDK